MRVFQRDKSDRYRDTTIDIGYQKRDEMEIVSSELSQHLNKRLLNTLLIAY